MILVRIKESEIKDYQDVADYIYYDNGQGSWIVVYL